MGFGKKLQYRGLEPDEGGSETALKFEMWLEIQLLDGLHFCDGIEH